MKFCFIKRSIQTVRQPHLLCIHL